MSVSTTSPSGPTRSAKSCARSPVPPARSSTRIPVAHAGRVDGEALPQPMQPGRHQVVHQVVLAGDGVEHAAHAPRLVVDVDLLRSRNGCDRSSAFRGDACHGARGRANHCRPRERGDPASLSCGLGSPDRSHWVPAPDSAIRGQALRVGTTGEQDSCKAWTPSWSLTARRAPSPCSARCRGCRCPRTRCGPSLPCRAA